MTPDYVLRALEIGDRGFVFNAWIKAAFEVEPTCYQVRARYEAAQRAHIDACLESATAMVACHPDDPTQLFGFVCLANVAGMPVVHWIYVRNHFRKMGLARSILRRLVPDTSAIVATQWSKDCAWIRRKTKLYFDPNLVHDLKKAG